MKRSERAKREKKPVSYKEEVLSEEELDPKSIEEPENQSEEEVKEIKKTKKKEDDSESEEFELHDDVEDEISISSDEEIEDADLDEEYEKKIKPGRKRKGNQKLQDVLPKSEKKTRGRKKKETEVPDKKEIKLPRELKAKTKCNLDPDFNLDRDYFYQNLTEIEEEEIKVYLKDFFKDDKIRDETEIKDFLGKYPNLRKNKANLDFIQKEINTTLSNNTIFNSQFLEKYNKLSNLLLNEYYSFKPVVLEAHFFPNPDNEVKVVNLLRKAKISLFIAIFTLTNDRISAAIQEAHERGVSIMIIADDEMAKCMGADVFKLASLGIPVKTDNSVKFHMHHKFCIIDESIVITGSFNWTSQAVLYNQENILFYENSQIARKYIDEFHKLWSQFEITITKEQAFILIEEDNKKKLEYAEKSKETRAKNKAEKDQMKSDKN